MSHLIKPHGGVLCDLLVKGVQLDKIREESLNFPSLTLNDRQICDIEMLLNGSFSPLIGFLSKDDYNSVLQDLRLADGTLWPIPITLDVAAKFANEISVRDKIVLRDHEGVAIAVLTISDIWIPDKEKEAEQVYGTKDTVHPAVDYLLNQSGEM